MPSPPQDKLAVVLYALSRTGSANATTPKGVSECQAILKEYQSINTQGELHSHDFFKCTMHTRQAEKQGCEPRLIRGEAMECVSQGAGCRGDISHRWHATKTNVMNTNIKLSKRARTKGAVGYILLWLLGIPLPILIIVYLLKGG